MRAQPSDNAELSRSLESAVTVTLVAVPAAGHLLGYLIPTLHHVRDRSWPEHARFHALQSLLFTVGWDTTVLFLAAGCRRRARWVRWPLAIYFVFVQGGYFVALATLPSGRPRGRRYHLAFALSAALYGYGVVRLAGTAGRSLRRSEAGGQAGVLAAVTWVSAHSQRPSGRTNTSVAHSSASSRRPR